MLNINHSSQASVGVGQGSVLHRSMNNTLGPCLKLWSCGKIPCVSQFLNASRTFLSASGM